MNETKLNPKYHYFCMECGNEFTQEDEILPDYPGLYECRKCGHPHSIKFDMPQWTDQDIKAVMEHGKRCLASENQGY